MHIWDYGRNLVSNVSVIVPANEDRQPGRRTDSWTDGRCRFLVSLTSDELVWPNEISAHNSCLRCSCTGRNSSFRPRHEKRFQCLHQLPFITQVTHFSLLSHKRLIRLSIFIIISSFSHDIANITLVMD